MSQILKTGTLISRRYEVLGQLGQGSMGIVYKVRHTVLDTIWALKVLPFHLAQSPDLVKRFYREARVMARLAHPNIARVVDIQQDDIHDFHYFVMEYINGITLLEYLRKRGCLSLDDTLTLGRQITEALQYAHHFTPPIIHRDIKPTNIMIEDETRRFILMDFGIAKELGEVDLTRAGMVLGTIRYCSPEQMGHRNLDGSTDIHALGIVLYEVYTGTPLFQGMTEEQVICRVLDPAEYELSFPPDTPEQFISIIRKAIAKNQEDRYRDEAELLTDLNACRAAPSKPPSTLIPVRDASGMEIGDIDEQIQTLERERNRRRIIQFRDKAQEHREHAVREGAHKWKPDLFKRASEAEQTAHEYLSQSEFTLAYESYQTAMALFAKAGEQAKIEYLRHAANEARNTAEEAQRDADIYNGAERAPSSYQQGLTLKVQAEQFWQLEAYAQAMQIYGEARAVFEHVHTRSYHALIQDETRSMQDQVKAARELASGENAADLARTEWSEAVRSEEQANLAFGNDEVPLALEVYRTALQKYVSARQTAQTKKQQEAARIALGTAIAAREAAEAAGADASCAAYQAGEQALARAETLTHGEDNDAVLQEYRTASAHYEEARCLAERARQREEAAAARQRTEEARATASDTGAERWFPEAFAGAAAELGQGETFEAAEDFPSATNCFQQAADTFLQLAEQAKATQAREAADAAQRKFGQLTQENAGLLVGATPRESGLDLFQRARDAEHTAQDHFRQSQFTLACESYLAAADLFGQAAARAEAEILLRKASQAREELEEAQRQADAHHGRQRADSLYRRGLALKEEADQYRKREDHDKAMARCGEARAVFEQVREQACRAELEESTRTARGQAKAARDLALGENAANLAGAEWSEAVQAEEDAHSALRDEEFEQATQLYQAAVERYVSARQTACRIKQEQAIEEARQAAETARQSFDDSTREGAASLPDAARRKVGHAAEQAESAWDQQRFSEAKDLFEAALNSYLAALAETEHERRHQHALEAQGQARELHENATNAAVPQYAPELYQQALTYLREGDRCLDGKLWEPSAESYARAGIFFRQSLDRANRRKAREAASEARDQALAMKASLAESKAIEIFPAEVSEVLSTLELAERAFSRGEDADAVTLFNESSARQKQIHHNTEQYRQRLELKDYQARIRILQHQAREQPGNRKHRQANKTLARAENAMAAGNYAEARPAFEQAIRCYEALLEPPVPSLWTRRVRPHRFKLLGGLLLVLLVAAIAHFSLQTKEPSPEIINASPDSSLELSLNEGEIQVFSVTASSAEGGPLRYTWFLDGQKMAEGPEWAYQPDFGAASATPKQVTVLIQDARNQRAERSWRVSVKDVDRRPVIEKALPQAKAVEVTAGDAHEFTIRAVDPDPSDRLVYTWFVNTSKVAEGEKWTFHATEPNVTYEIRAQVTDREELTDERTWTVHVKAPPVKALRPPELVQTRPTAGPSREISVREGQSQLFSVTAQSPDQSPLQYTWYLDGKAVGKGVQWSWQPDFEKEKTHREVKVVIVDAQQQQAQARWSVRVEPANQPPRIVSATPSQARPVELAPREAKTFSVEAVGHEKSDVLHFVWQFDGTEVGKEKNWRLSAPESEGRHRVTVHVSNSAGLMAESAWTVMIRKPAAPPKISTFTPDNAAVTAEVGRAIEFAVSAEIPGADQSAVKALKYRWVLDGRTQNTAAGAAFRLIENRPGRHQLSVTTSTPEGLQSETVKWAIDIPPPPAPVMPAAPAQEPENKPPETQPAPEPPRQETRITEDDVHRWLDLYRQAWDEKQVETLVKIGETSRSNAEKLAQILAKYEVFHISLESIHIELDGRRAVVSLKRVDHINGRTLPQPGTKAFILEKRDDGRVVRQ